MDGTVDKLWAVPSRDEIGRLCGPNNPRNSLAMSKSVARLVLRSGRRAVAVGDVHPFRQQQVGRPDRRADQDLLDVADQQALKLQNEFFEKTTHPLDTKQ